jgi:hypothetical protein
MCPDELHARLTFLDEKQVNILLLAYGNWRTAIAVSEHPSGAKAQQIGGVRRHG